MDWVMFIIKSYPHGPYDAYFYETVEKHIDHEQIADLSTRDMELLEADIENIRKAIDSYLDTFFRGREELYMFQQFIDRHTALFISSELVVV